MSFAAVVLATRCGFPATAPLAEKVDCKDDQDGQDDYHDDQDNQDQDDDHEDQDEMDSAFVINITPTPLLPALISGSCLMICRHLFPEAFSILSAFFPLQTDVTAINESQMPLLVSMDKTNTKGTPALTQLHRHIYF